MDVGVFCVWQVDDPGIKRALIDGFPGVLETPDQHGRKILILFASNWDQSRWHTHTHREFSAVKICQCHTLLPYWSSSDRYLQLSRCSSLLFTPPSLCRNSFIDILRALLLSLEVLIEKPEQQIHGFLLLIDWSDFSFKQASKLTPNILKLAIEGLQVSQLTLNVCVCVSKCSSDLTAPPAPPLCSQDSFPARFGGIHFVNQPWFIHAMFTIIRPFLKDKTRKRVRSTRRLLSTSSSPSCHQHLVFTVHSTLPIIWPFLKDETKNVRSTLHLLNSDTSFSLHQHHHYLLSTVYAMFNVQEVGWEAPRLCFHIICTSSLCNQRCRVRRTLHLLFFTHL